MGDAPPRRAWLLAHPDVGGDAGWNLAVEVDFSAGSGAVCRYALRGDMTRIRLPRAGAGRRADGLWRQTCFEAFFAVPESSVYYEFNFSPALDWAAYRFDGYRSGMSAAPLTQPPGLTVRRGPDQLELTASVHFAGVEPLVRARAVRLALAAVIEEEGGRLGYWALRHAPGNPDFHHPEAFALELGGPAEHGVP